MARPNYAIPDSPAYNPAIPSLLDQDPASATQTFNPLFLRIIENAHAVKLAADRLREQVGEMQGGLAGGGAVSSVNGRAGEVALSAADVGAAAAGHAHASDEIMDNSIVGEVPLPEALQALWGLIHSHRANSAWGVNGHTGNVRLSARDIIADNEVTAAMLDSVKALGKNIVLGGNDISIHVHQIDDFDIQTFNDSLLIALGRKIRARSYSYVDSQKYAWADFHPMVAIGFDVDVLDGSVGIGSRICNDWYSVAVGNDIEVLGGSIAIGSIINGDSGGDILIGSRCLSNGGGSNIAIGSGASASGNNAVVIGNAASANGTTSIAIGNGARVGTASRVGSVAFGRLSECSHANAAIFTPNSTATRRSTNSDNRILLGFSGITPAGFAAFSNVSDERDKRDIAPLGYDALEFITALEPVQYRMDFRSDYARYEEITEKEFEKLDGYARRHEVYEEKVWTFEGSGVEWLANDAYFSEREGRYATKFIREYRESEAAALEALKGSKQHKNMMARLSADSGGDEAAEGRLSPVTERSTKFLRVQVEPDGTRAGRRYHNGFIAQQVEAAARGMGFDCPAVEHLAHNRGEDGIPEGDDLYSMKYTELMAPMAAAIRQLAAKNAELEARLARLEATAK